MALDLTPEDRAFRAEVRAFLAEHLSEEIRAGSAATPSVFVEPDIGQAWNAILHRKGWLAYQW
ncbi:acyl-CoA dehydrogenase, partial [Pseudomonas sp. FW305-130]